MTIRPSAKVSLCVSGDMLAEVRDVLTRPKTQKKIDR